MSNLLLAFALEQESANIFNDYNTLYTGIGKIQSCLSLIKTIEQQKPDVVVNLGTAGGKNFNHGEVVNPTAFIQRDMDATGLGFELYKTPFSEFPVRLEYGLKVEGLPQAICGTGDNFSVAETFGNGAYNVVDMEAYALAAVCKDYGIPFVCLKYISDGANGEANQDWETALKIASKALRKTFENKLLPILNVSNA